MNPLTSIPAAIISGGVFAVIVFVTAPGTDFNTTRQLRESEILLL